MEVTEVEDTPDNEEIGEKMVEEKQDEVMEGITEEDQEERKEEAEPSKLTDIMAIINNDEFDLKSLSNINLLTLTTNLFEVSKKIGALQERAHQEMGERMN